MTTLSAVQQLSLIVVDPIITLVPSTTEIAIGGSVTFTLVSTPPIPDWSDGDLHENSRAFTNNRTLSVCNQEAWWMNFNGIDYNSTSENITVTFNNAGSFSEFSGIYSNALTSVNFNITNITVVVGESVTNLSMANVEFIMANGTTISATSNVSDQCLFLAYDGKSVAKAQHSTGYPWNYTFVADGATTIEAQTFPLQELNTTVSAYTATDNTISVTAHSEASTVAPDVSWNSTVTGIYLNPTLTLTPSQYMVPPNDIVTLTLGGLTAADVAGDGKGNVKVTTRLIPCSLHTKLLGVGGQRRNCPIVSHVSYNEHLLVAGWHTRSETPLPQRLHRSMGGREFDGRQLHFGGLISTLLDHCYPATGQCNSEYEANDRRQHAQYCRHALGCLQCDLCCARCGHRLGACASRRLKEDDRRHLDMCSFHRTCRACGSSVHGHLVQW